MLRNQVFSLLNISGLSIGIAAFWMILHYVFFERSYERFMDHGENIYRVQLDVHRNQQLVYQSSENYAGVGEALKKELPEVIEFGRFYNMGSKNQVNITWYDAPVDPVTLKQKRFLYADETVLDLFSYQVNRGESSTALKEPFTIAISERMAQKYFKGADPIGKFLRLEDDDFNNELCKVTAVFQDSPPNTHLKFDVLISFSTLYSRDDGEGWAIPRYKTGWGRKDYYTYVLLRAGTDPKEVERKLPAIVEKYKPELAERGDEDVLRLQPVKDIHLTSRLTDEAEVNGDGEAVLYLSIIAIFIIVIAWINYINLGTAKAIDRAKEVGLRKVLGSRRGQLMVQFLLESLMIKAMAILVAAVLVLLFMPLFNQIGGTPSSHLIWTQPWFWISMVLLLVVGGLVSGIYPSLVLSSYKPITVLRGKLKTSLEGISLRRALVTLQFAVSVGLIIGTGIVYQQMAYMQERDLGFDPEQIVVVTRPAVRDTSNEVAGRNFDSFKNGLKNQSDIVEVGTSLALPGKKLRFKTPVRSKGMAPSEALSFAISMMDYEFMDLMAMELVAGRNFSRDFTNDEDTSVLVNETAAIALGFEQAEDAIGENITFDQWEWQPKIIGVVKDFHQESLQEPIVPISFALGSWWLEYYMIKIKTNDVDYTMDKIEKQWHASFAGNPFDYLFLDEYFNSYYQAEQRFQHLFTVFSVLAIFIGVLGLFGLSLFSTVQRAKEIGIRKVLGASIANVVGLLLSDIVKLLLFANLVAWPLAYYFMKGWLENYPYATEISWFLFVGAGLTVILVAFATVAFQTIRSARANPVESLKYE